MGRDGAAAEAGTAADFRGIDPQAFLAVGELRCSRRRQGGFRASRTLEVITNHSAPAPPFLVGRALWGGVQSVGWCPKILSRQRFESICCTVFWFSAVAGRAGFCWKTVMSRGGRRQAWAKLHRQESGRSGATGGRPDGVEIHHRAAVWWHLHLLAPPSGRRKNWLVHWGRKGWRLLFMIFELRRSCRAMLRFNSAV